MVMKKAAQDGQDQDFWTDNESGSESQAERQTESVSSDSEDVPRTTQRRQNAKSFAG